MPTMAKPMAKSCAAIRRAPKPRRRAAAWRFLRHLRQVKNEASPTRLPAVSRVIALAARVALMAGALPEFSGPARRVAAGFHCAGSALAGLPFAVAGKPSFAVRE